MKVLKNYSIAQLWSNLESWKNQWINMKRNDVNIQISWFLNNMKETINKFINVRKIKLKNEFFDNQLEQMRQ